MDRNVAARHDHAVLDLPSRRRKALKIERLLQMHALRQPIRMLEVGTGSGGIANYFGSHPTLRCAVTAVDVVDKRLVRDGYDFVRVADTRLPFADASYDVVLSNHVIEHVGGAAEQRHHLGELRRVLKAGGIGYLAVPNRWMLVEPHYRLAFLSWLPVTWRTPYLRLMRKGGEYDCNPLTRGAIEGLLRDSGFRPEYLGTRALRELFAIEGAHGLFAKVAQRMPDVLLDALAPLNPTLIYKLI